MTLATPGMWQIVIVGANGADSNNFSFFTIPFWALCVIDLKSSPFLDDRQTMFPIGTRTMGNLNLNLLRNTAVVLNGTVQPLSLVLESLAPLALCPRVAA